MCVEGGSRARARARDHALLLGREIRESAAAAAAADGQRLGSRVEESAARCVDVRARARARLSPFADGSDEQAVFAAAMEATIPGASVEAGDCTQLSRRRNLLTASEASLAFTVTVSGTAALTATANSITSVVNDAVDSGDFTDALTTAAADLGLTDFTAPTVTGTSVNIAPTAAPTASPVAPRRRRRRWRRRPRRPLRRRSLRSYRAAGASRPASACSARASPRSRRRGFENRRGGRIAKSVVSGVPHTSGSTHHTRQRGRRALSERPSCARGVGPCT